MSKRRTAKRQEPEPAKDVGVDQLRTGEGPAQSRIRFQFHKFLVRRMHFEELPLVALNGEADPATYGLELQIQVFVGLADTGRDAEVRMIVDAKPDPRSKPYLIQVEVVGLFSVVDGNTEQLNTFCQAAAPTILFPYVRQLIDTATADGRYGSVRLDPMNLQQTIKPEGWKRLEPQP